MHALIHLLPFRQQYHQEQNKHDPKLSQGKRQEKETP
jgi:hypothetical protein